MDEQDGARTKARWLRHLPGWAPNVALSVATLVVILGLAEGVGRLLERGRPQPHVADYIANWDEWDGEFFTATGGRNARDYNRDGLRDREHAVTKLPGIQRVMCLGDSTTYGQHLEPREAYPQILQALADERRLGIEVFNVALAGWSARQELIAYRRICRKYAPDHVILMLCLNDVADMQNNLSRPPEWLVALHRHSALVRALVGAQGREIRDVRELFRKEEPPRVSEGWAVLFSEIRRLRDEVNVDGAKLSLLVLPFRFQVEPGAPEPIAQQRIAAFCAETGTPCLDLLPALEPFGARAFACPDHLSAVGTRVVAEAVLASDLLPHAMQAPPPELPEDVPALLRTLADTDPGLRVAAAAALGGHGEEREVIAPALVTALAQDAHDGVRLAASEALIRLQPRTTVVEPLARIVESEESRGSAEAARVLGALGPTAAPAVDALITALAANDPALRREAAVALGEIGPAARNAAPELSRTLERDNDDAVRAEAADALGEIGPVAAEAVPALRKALADPNGQVRLVAARSLGRIGPSARPAVPALVTALGDRNPDVRLMAARALPRAGARLEEAESALEHLTREDDDNVRREAKAALRHLRASAQR